MQVEEEQSDSDLPVFKVGAAAMSMHPTSVVVEVKGQALTMEVDTGTAVSIISEKTWKRESQ